jgi:hypothetical protein
MEATGVVNLKFLSQGWQARGRNIKFENHAGNNDLSMQHLNPKFALAPCPKVMRIPDRLN